MADSHRHEQVKTQRQQSVAAILDSESRHKIVVAGPGTGKTYLFKEMLKGKTNTLTLTFVNALVEDLSLELYGTSEVRTLHSYARAELGKFASTSIKVFPKLPQIVKEDAKLLLDRDIDFDFIFNNRDDENADIGFYKRRKDYYDKHYGYSDVIFGIVKQFEKTPDKVPSYQQVVVDEFQDFNKLEVSLIEHLSARSPVLLAGDDDQALYAFKSASPEHIRHKYGSGCPAYAAFNLPFCSRCTRVIVEATNDIVAGALKIGLLVGRINKPYMYFDSPQKDHESDINPKLAYSQVFASQLPWFIEQRIMEIATDEKGAFTVLVISPTTSQVRALARGLRKKGFNKVDFVERPSGQEPSLLDGLKLLLENKAFNLGWRIVAKHMLKPEDFVSLVKESNEDGAKPLAECIDGDIKKKVDQLLSICRKARDERDIDKDALIEAMKRLDLDPHEILTDSLRDEVISSGMRGGDPALRRIPFTMTTVQSSKGLAADYVFITHFDDQYFVKDKDKSNIADQDVCNLLVAMTRARKKLYLLSTSTAKEPTYMSWIDANRIERI
ncbi:MAG: ATP-dependent helicase [Methylomonas sp.]|nr:ATP-dependent helicase [Methylomonas sp.]